jgi:hypothetical protein
MKQTSCSISSPCGPPFFSSVGFGSTDCWSDEGGDCGASGAALLWSRPSRLENVSPPLPLPRPRRGGVLGVGAGSLMLSFCNETGLFEEY